MLVHLYAQSSVNLPALGLSLTQETTQPWDGRVTLTLALDASREFTLKLRIPEWCNNSFARINGGDIEASAARMVQGYLCLSREWQHGDTVTLDLDMAPTLISAHPLVPQTQGRVALQRGPLIYCLEGADNGASLDGIVLPEDATWADAALPASFGLPGAIGLTTRALKAVEKGWGPALYRAEAPDYAPVEITAVPYFAWDNRGAGEMRIWVRSI